MKIKLLFAALLLGSAAHAQTAPTTTSPDPVTPASPAPRMPPPIGTIDTRPMPSTQQPRQDRVRKRQTVMDGKASPGVENKEGRRTKRTNPKKRPASESPATEPRPR